MNDAYEKWLAAGNKPTQLPADATAGKTRYCINCGLAKPEADFKLTGNVKCRACYERRGLKPGTHNERDNKRKD
jgi:hypothetical protein